MNKYSIYLQCKICQKNFENGDEIAKHVKIHKTTAKKYFTQYYPKSDFLDAQPIEYKSFEQYYLNDFTNKRNLKKWLKECDIESSCSYLITKLTDYCLVKGLDCIPSQSQIKTIACLPSIEIFHEFCGKSFCDIANSLKLKCNFNYKEKHTIKDLNNISLDQMVIDTREQKPLQFNGLKIISSKLECGDYAIYKDDSLVIERKSITDFFSTLSGGFDRFVREIERAKKLGVYIVVLIESPLNTALYCKRTFGMCSGDYIMHHMRKICRQFNNVQFVFCDGRADLTKKVLYILDMKEQAKTTDLQYLFDNEVKL
jgi:acetone carboxylase gamma subunit